jgi:hypothetical protein
LGETDRRAAADATPRLVVAGRGEAYWVGRLDSCEAYWAAEGEEARGGAGLPDCGTLVWPRIATTRQPGGGPHGAAAHQVAD